MLAVCTQLLQRLAYKYYPDTLSDFALSSVAAVGSIAKLRELFSNMTSPQLFDLARRLHLIAPAGSVPSGSDAGPLEFPRALVEGVRALPPSYTSLLPLHCICAGWPHRRSCVFIAEIMVTAHSLQRNTLDDINAMPLYPTEALLWDDTVLPLSEFQAGSMLALPKLNLQVIDTHMRIYLFV